MRSLFDVCACWTDVEFAQSLTVGLRLAFLDVRSRFYEVLVSAVVVELLLYSHVMHHDFQCDENVRICLNSCILPTVVLIQ